MAFGMCFIALKCIIPFFDKIYHLKLLEKMSAKKAKNGPTTFYNFSTTFASNQTAQEDILWNQKS